MEEEDISEGVMPMFIMFPSNSGVETFDPLLSPTAPQIGPWCSTNDRRRQINKQKQRGAAAESLPSVWLLSGVCCYTGTAVSTLDYGRVRSVQPPACCTSPAKSKRLRRCRGIRGRCVYLSAAPAAVLGGKSAAPRWRDAIC